MKKTKYVYLIISIVIASCVLAIDLCTPLGTVAGGAYVILMLLSLCFPYKRYVYGTAIITSLLVIIGYFISASYNIEYYLVPPIINRLFSIIAIWITAIIALSFIRRAVTVRTSEQQDRKTEQQEVQDQVDELSRSNKDLEEFTYIASHDLQEPLRKIHSFATLIRDSLSEQLNETQCRYLGYILDGAKRMQELIDNLLLLARVDIDGHLKTKCDLSILAHKVVNDIGLTCEVSGIESLPIIESNPKQMYQLLSNIIENATKYRIDTVPLKIQISTKSLPCGKYKISIQDNGIGFDNKNKDKIFVTFTRLHNNKNYPGSGIGLSICKRIVLRHGGIIGATGKPNKGSIFWFII